MKPTCEILAIKGTSEGKLQPDAMGVYSLRVEPQTILQFSFAGLRLSNYG